MGKSTVKTIANAVNLQDVSSKADGGCPSTLSSTTTYNLTDTRDGQTYQVARLADGNCWMITNLNLGAVASTVTLNSSNTNINNGSTISANDWNSYKKNFGTKTYIAAEYIQVSGIDSYNNLPFGTLYNYCATSAKTICTDSNSSNATSDICPAGWRLPTGGTSGEFQALYDSGYSSVAKLRAAASNGGASFAYAGTFYDSTPYDQTHGGRWWTSSIYDTTSMRGLYISGADWVDTGDYTTRVRGRSVRCVLR